MSFLYVGPEKEKWSEGGLLCMLVSFIYWRFFFLCYINWFIEEFFQKVKAKAQPKIHHRQKVRQRPITVPRMMVSRRFLDKDRYHDKS